MQHEISAVAGRTSAALKSESVPVELLPARQRFRDLVVERILTLESLRIRVSNRQEPRAALSAIVALCHKIAGVAGSLGYVSAGNLAASVERAYRDQAELKLPLNDLWSLIEPRVLALMDELEALLDE